MGKKINNDFLKYYTEMDVACCEKFGVSTGGTGEYINRLNNARYAPDREDVLPRLVKYRSIQKQLSTDAKAAKKDNGLTKEDLKWLQDFKKKVSKKQDPISQYLKKAKKYASKERTTAVFCVILGIVAVAAVAIILL